MLDFEPQKARVLIKLFISHYRSNQPDIRQRTVLQAAESGASGSAMADCPEPVTHLVVVIEQAQRSCAVFIPVDAHHGLGGRSERVFQERLPGLILAGVGAPLRIKGLVLKDQHWPFASEEETQS